MRQEHIGKKFGMLLVLESLPLRKCVCVCDCGAKVTRRSDHVISGLSKSCGCSKGLFVSQGKVVHGEGRRVVKSAEFKIWVSLRSRCADLSDPAYGGRGIKIHESWNDFETFLKDMGRRPTSDHQIDRIDNDGDYAPGNCRWATRSEQCRNRRTSRMVTVNGQTKTLAEWAESSDLKYATILRRLNTGCDPAAALTTPVGRL